ncbi:MAG: PhzF family phenazine biosynthesis protein, partial [Nannocystaceae bacterium]
MPTPLFQVDAFARRVLQGNPAAVCLLEQWPDDEVLQQIAQENNLSETAFLVRDGLRTEIRWFTPTVEVDLCGHATLASA